MYRVGRKQNRVILDNKGNKVAEFDKGQEELAGITCELLNNKSLLLTTINHSLSILIMFGVAAFSFTIGVIFKLLLQ